MLRPRSVSLMVCLLRQTRDLARDTQHANHRDRVDDKRVAGATAIGLAFPAAEWGITRPGPAPGIMIESLWPTQLVQLRQALLDRLLCIVEELPLVGGTGRTTFCTGTVI